MVATTLSVPSRTVDRSATVDQWPFPSTTGLSARMKVGPPPVDCTCNVTTSRCSQLTTPAVAHGAVPVMPTVWTPPARISDGIAMVAASGAVWSIAKTKVVADSGCFTLPDSGTQLASLVFAGPVARSGQNAAGQMLA